MDNQNNPAFLDKYLLPASILVAAVLIAGSVFYSTQRGSVTNGNNVAVNPGDNGDNEPAPAAQLPPIGSNDVVLGQASAPVSVIEYGDYQCPWCSKFFVEVEPMIRKEFIDKGKVKMAFRSFQFLGAESKLAAEAVECAKDQGKFWEFHDAIYNAEHVDGQENNGNLDKALFMKLAGDLKMDTGPFGSCFDSHKHAAKVQSDYAAAGSAGVNGTPSVFVNGKTLGAWTAQTNPFQSPANLAAVRTFLNDALAGN